MRKKMILRICALAVLSAIFLIVCISDPMQLRFAASRYNRILDGELPKEHREAMGLLNVPNGAVGFGE